MKNDLNDEDLIENAKITVQGFLDKGEEPMATCLVYKKNGHMEVIGLQFNQKNKEAFRTQFKELLVKKKIKKYVMIMDTKLTMTDLKNPDNEPKVTDAIMISVCSPNDKLVKIFPYTKENMKLDEKSIHDIRGRTTPEGKYYDCWDIWGEETPVNTPHDNFDYQEFKKTHKELYRGLDKEEDELYDIRNKGTKERVDIALGFHLDIYRYNKKAIFEAVNNDDKAFLTSVAIPDDENFDKKLKETITQINIVGKKLDEIERGLKEKNDKGKRK